jgi:hypothetical protein
MHHLDVNHPTATKSITTADASNAKFVEVDVTQVANPAHAAISFTVAYQTASETLVLGSFSLYPADHPGTFIVPTQGKIGASGAIRVTMENPDNDARIRVTLADIKLVTRPTSSPAPNDPPH